MRKRKYNVLIVYYREVKDIRKTIEDSIFCFSRYKPDNINIFYYSYRPDIDMSILLKKMEFDIVIFHSIFMTQRWNWQKIYWDDAINKFANVSKNAIKVIFAQDEEYRTDRIYDFVNKVGVEIIFTVCSNDSAIEKIYPSDKIKVKKIEKVLTGYVDYTTFKKIKEIRKNERIERNIDIGYRADITPYALGFQGRLKSLIPEVFNDKLEKYSKLKFDIKNTEGKKNLFVGLDWFRFMLQCNTMISCMGGASILDIDGRIRAMVDTYTKNNPKATYEDIKREILDVYGEEIDYVMMSPRCFETAMTRTCQILVEGDYAGIFKPDVHYIELKKDFSNIDEVVEKVKDKKLCKKIADRAYNDIIKSGKYTYKEYVYKVFSIIEPYVVTKTNCVRNEIINFVLRIYNFLVDRRIIVDDYFKE